MVQLIFIQHTPHSGYAHQCVILQMSYAYAWASLPAWTVHSPLLASSLQTQLKCRLNPPPLTPHTSCLEPLLMPDCIHNHAHGSVSTDRCRHSPAFPRTGSLNSHAQPLHEPILQMRKSSLKTSTWPQTAARKGQGQDLAPNLPGWLLPFHPLLSLESSPVYLCFPPSQALTPTSVFLHSKHSHN